MEQREALRDLVFFDFFMHIDPIYPVPFTNDRVNVQFKLTTRKNVLACGMDWPISSPSGHGKLGYWCM